MFNKEECTHITLRLGLLVMTKVTPRDRQKAGRGQASVHSQGRVQNGTGWQAGSRSGAGRVVRQVGSESGQARVKTRRARKRETGKKQELREKPWLTWQTR